ncbi:hypothetical protein ASG40_17345 [Methylobacterium sp. Leaf399]|uniref:GT-D fold domain-containing protein n=1 Tax=Methylobacterium sp. Leaf399 TaxID=1736364 RepID=UPI000701A512|nr:hypothetical protein [Methylobacterium sp. Leaf399]KQT17776.1 hypothetical protein ASG40_17345 [Methylobacterium sp. Leaf399]
MASTTAEEGRAALMQAACAVIDGAIEPAESAATHPVWGRRAREVARCILEEDLDGFTRWPVVMQTMFVGEQPDTRRQLDALKSLPDWRLRWRPALKESALGRPAASSLHPASSANQIRQAYLLARFEAAMETRIDAFDQIVEFGAGFGALCLLARRLGFGGRYVLLDIEPMRSLQRWYLRSNGIAVTGDGTLPEAGAVTLPVSELPKLFPETDPRTAFLAHCSLGETPIPLRDEMLHTLKRVQTEAIWLVYQQNFGVHNSHYFAGAAKDFLNVYEVGIRPLEPGAAPDSPTYGHACLALKRVPGRAFRPGIKNLRRPPFETRDMRRLAVEEVSAVVRRAVDARTPLSLLRLGDGEGRVIGYPDHVPPRLLADIWRVWFGHAGFTDEAVARLRHDLKIACREADVVGIPKAEPDVDCEFGRVAALLPREDFITPSTLLCHAGVHFGLQRAGLYPALLAGLPYVGVIGPRDLGQVLPALYGVRGVAWLPVPPEMAYSDLPEAEKAALVSADAHLNERYPELMEREIPDLLARAPGLLVLVGAGILGKIYCGRVRQLGGIAIDVGSMMDVWAGLKTRDNQDFANLRPVFG